MGTDADTDEEITELTNIKVKEVSLVDRAANRRTFLVTKKDKQPRSMRPATEEEIKATKSDETPAAPAVVPAVETPAPVVAPVVETPAAKADETPTPAVVPVVETPAPVVAPVVAAKADETPAPAVVPVVETPAPVVETPAAKAESPAPAPAPEGVNKESTTVAVGDDGTVTVTTEPDEAPPARIPAELAAKIKAATLAGIDAISARIATFRAAVEADDKIGEYSSGSSTLWDHTYYLQSMIDALYNIGGPAWEIEQAGDDVAKAAVKERLAGVMKAHKAITAMRVAKMGGIHKAMTMCTKDMGDLVTELTETAASDSKDSGSSFAKADDIATPPVVAAAAPAAPSAEVEELKKAADIAKAAATTAAEQSAALTAQLAAATKKNAELSALVVEQGNVIKAGNFSVQKSNASDQKDIEKAGTDNANVAWPRDLAAKDKPQRGKSFR